MLTTLQRGLHVIEALADGPLTVRQISERIGLPRQNVYRIAVTLVEAGWVTTHPQSGAYSLTRRAWSIAHRSLDAGDLREMWAPTVRRLAATGDTVHLAVYEAGEVVYIDKAEGKNPVRAYSQLGGRAPAHCVATGKVLLASLQPVDLDDLLDGPLISATPATIVDRAMLRKHLEGVRQRGFATNLGEWRRDVGGVAVPILSPTGTVVAALGFSAPLYRLKRNIHRHLTLLQEAIAQQHGGSRPRLDLDRAAEVVASVNRQADTRDP